MMSNNILHQRGPSNVLYVGKVSPDDTSKHTCNIRLIKIDKMHLGIGPDKMRNKRVKDDEAVNFLSPRTREGPSNPE